MARGGRDRLGREERDRPQQPSATGDRLGGGIGGRGQQEAAFRDQAGRGQKPQHPVKADPVADRGKQVRQRVFMADRRARTDLFRRHRLGHRGGEAQRADAEARVDLVQPSCEQYRDPGGVAHRAGEANLHLCRAVIDPPQLQPQPARAHPVPGQIGAKPVEQAIKPRPHIRLQADRLRQGHPHRELGRVRFRRHRLRLRAQRLIQPQHQPRPEASRQGRARQPDQVGNARKADPRQRLGRGMIDPECCDRQVPDTLGQPSIRHNAAAMAGQRMGRPTGAGNGAGGMQARPFQPGLQVVAQPGLTTEEMRHARNIGHQPIDTIRRHHRRIATGPATQGGQGGGFARQIGRTGGKIRADGARIGQCHAAMQTAGRGGGVQTVQMIGIARAMGQRKGPLNGAAPQARVAGEPRKPYGQQPTRHSSSRPSFLKFPLCSF